jgi:hypothetical protein
MVAQVMPVPEAACEGQKSVLLEGQSEAVQLLV